MAGHRPASREPWTRAEAAVLDRLDAPGTIQRFLDSIPYSEDPIYRCPRRVLADRKAHCYDGALFAAAALARLGVPPLIVNLRAVNDDDHVIALYRVRGAWGAVAKSNVVGLRFREPIHRSLRELVMTYFEPYYNLDGERTLRAFSRPLDLGRCDHLEWRTRDAAMDVIAERLDARRHYSLLAPAMVQALGRLDERSYRAGLLGANEAGLYRPGKGRA
jgi:hypothetical protein